MKFKKQTTEPFLDRPITELSFLLGPTTLVAIVCSLFSMSPQRTGLFSLGVVLLLATLRYSNYIDKKLSSSLLILFLLGSVFLFLLFRQGDLSREAGLVDFFKESNAYLASGLKQSIANATDEIWFLGIHFSKSSEDIREALIKKLRSGVDIKYLVLNPAENVLRPAIKDLGERYENLKDECYLSAYYILTTEQQWAAEKRNHTNPGSFELRFYEDIPKLRAYVFDPEEDYGQLYLIPYMYNVPSRQLPGFLFRTSSSGGVYESYYYGLKRLWVDSVTAEELLRSDLELKAYLESKGLLSGAQKALSAIHPGP